MLCQRCLKRDARFHSYRIINNELVDVHLCSRCVESNGNQEETNNIGDKLHSLLEVLLKADIYNGSSSSVLRCDGCGTTLKEIEKYGLAGCPRCYECFSHQLLKDTDITYSTESGSINTKESSTFLDRLEKRLQRAVETEDFEEAAQIRDRIRTLEKEGFFGDS
jgi:protein arginine kinase activator